MSLNDIFRHERNQANEADFWHSFGRCEAGARAKNPGPESQGTRTKNQRSLDAEGQKGDATSAHQKGH